MARGGHSVRRTLRERSASTTAELLDRARVLFARDGYQATPLDAVVAAAGVTKGALYHHFGGKRELFQAVFVREQERLAELVSSAYLAEADPWDGFQAGCRVFLKASLDPGVQRITLLDAPAVLGWEAMRDIEVAYSLELLSQGLRAAIAAGRIAPRPVRPLAHLLLGAICEGAMMVARSTDQSAATDEVLREISTVLAALSAAKPAAAKG
ncbi:MAG: TetR/AcrR family transcriptional regulator [Actinomycetota bacterium]|nr:TetR/AcrR family transcriptional regulator [Actinomycetota bacterium]